MWKNIKLFKEVKNKRGTISYSWIRKLYIINIQIVPKLNNEFNTNLIVLLIFFVEFSNILKFK